MQGVDWAGVANGGMPSDLHIGDTYWAGMGRRWNGPGVVCQFGLKGWKGRWIMGIE